MHARGSGVQGHPHLHRKFEANLDYMRPCLNKNKQTKKGTCKDFNYKLSGAVDVSQLLSFFIVTWNSLQQGQTKWVIGFNPGKEGLDGSCENGFCLVHCSFLVSALQGKI